jgi:hypothetical protein
MIDCDPTCKAESPGGNATLRGRVTRYGSRKADMPPDSRCENQAMCGRFVTTTHPADLAAFLEAVDNTQGQVSEPDFILTADGVWILAKGHWQGALILIVGVIAMVVYALRFLRGTTRG